MKTIRTLLLVFMAISIFSCSTDDAKIDKVDFSVLGISTVTVNNVTFQVNADLLWATNGATPFYISATEMQTGSKQYVVEYVVASSGETKEVSATSIYSDAAIKVESATTTSGTEYKVVRITRPNFDEQLTYKIFFADVQD